MRQVIGAVLGMLAGIGLVATQVWLWWWLLFEESTGLKPSLISYVMWLIPGVFLFLYSYRRFKLVRGQQNTGVPVRAPEPSPAMRGLGNFFWISGHVVMALSILGTVAMLVSAYLAPSAGASGVPLGLGLILAAVLYAVGAGLKSG